MKNLIINNNDDFCHWNHNYPCKSGANILAFQNQAQDRSGPRLLAVQRSQRCAASALMAAVADYLGNYLDMYLRSISPPSVC